MTAKFTSDINPLILIWTWRYHSPEVDDYYDDWNDALLSFDDLSESDECVAEAIEIWDEAGHRFYGRKEATELAAATRRAQNAANPPTQYPPTVAYLWVRHPEEKRTWACLGSFSDMAKAEHRLAEVSERLGSRVQLTTEARRPWGDS